ncbi:hypothetical protein JB92DRAFT_3147508 [Gautieria morchelliformis]|nr:hypothetical protein JB92DRAFT_3147508 [Gautieria morchelliformis]
MGKTRKSLDAYVQDRISLDRRDNAIYHGVTEANKPAHSVGWTRRSRPSNTHSRRSRLFHLASFPPLSRVEPILPMPTPTPLPPLPYSPSPASLAEQIAFINLHTSSRAVPAPQPAYPPSHPFSARARSAQVQSPALLRPSYTCRHHAHEEAQERGDARVRVQRVCERREGEEGVSLMWRRGRWFLGAHFGLLENGVGSKGEEKSLVAPSSQSAANALHPPRSSASAPRSAWSGK